MSREHGPDSTSSGASYQILGHLATGGMAELFMARRGTAPDAPVVVLKRILAEHAKNPHFVTMFLDEARLVSRLNHPNIAQVIDVGRIGSSYFYTMELVHGENLRELLVESTRQERLVPLDAALAIISGAAAGLHAAHEQRDRNGRALEIVHRDVSPSNVMVGYDGVIKVVDFGVAKAADHVTETRSGTVKGKIAYLSPEQTTVQRVDRRSDIFSLGIVAFEVLTRRRLFRRGSDYETMHAIMHDDVPRPSQLRPELPPELDAIVLRALARDPDRRYQTCAELIVALDRVAASRRLAPAPAAVRELMTGLFGDRPAPWEFLTPESTASLRGFGAVEASVIAAGPAAAPEDGKSVDDAFAGVRDDARLPKGPDWDAAGTVAKRPSAFAWPSRPIATVRGSVPLPAAAPPSRSPGAPAAPSGAERPTLRAPMPPLRALPRPPPLPPAKPASSARPAAPLETAAPIDAARRESARIEAAPIEAAAIDAVAIDAPIGASADAPPASEVRRHSGPIDAPAPFAPALIELASIEPASIEPASLEPAMIEPASEEPSSVFAASAAIARDAGLGPEGTLSGATAGLIVLPPPPPRRSLGFVLAAGAAVVAAIAAVLVIGIDVSARQETQPPVVATTIERPSPVLTLAAPSIDPASSATDPATIDPTPSAIDPAPSAIDPAPPAIDPAPPAIDPAPATIDPAPATIDPAPPATNPAQPAIDPAPPATDPAPPATDPAPPATDPAPGTIAESPSRSRRRNTPSPLRDSSAGANVTTAPPTDDLEIALSTAEAAARASEWGIAYRQCGVALRIAPTNVRALVVCARAACLLGKHDGARAYLAQLSKPRADSIRKDCAARGQPID